MKQAQTWASGVAFLIVTLLFFPSLNLVCASVTDFLILVSCFFISSELNFLLYKELFVCVTTLLAVSAFYLSFFSFGKILPLA